jgi:hypothetical protein
MMKLFAACASLFFCVGAYAAELGSQAKQSFVVASSLKLRADPSESGKVLGKLAINTPVTVKQQSGVFVEVVVPSGKVGWVAAAMLAPDRLTVGGAKQKANAAATPAEALSWWQRAAAVDDENFDVLAALQKAYCAAGDVKQCARVEARIAVLKQRGKMLGVVNGHIEWVELNEPAGADLTRFGLDDKTTAWVLPVRGTAMRVAANKPVETVRNECGGTSGVDVPTSVHDGLLAMTDEPPPSWLVATTAMPDAKAKAIEKRARRHCRAIKGEACTVVVATSAGIGAAATVSWQLPAEAEGDDGPRNSETVVLYYDVNDTESEVEKRSGDWTIAAVRNVDRDDAPELLLEGCSRVVLKRNGTEVLSTTNRCCGC